MIAHRNWLLAIGASALLGFAATPALALDDDGHQSIFKTFSGILTTTIGVPGLGSRDEKPTINYRERAPLVLPPGNNLRAPLPPVGQRNAAWPVDQDIQRARRAARPVGTTLRDDAGNEILSPQYLRNTGRLARNPARDPVAEQCSMDDPLATPCNVKNMWSVLKNNRLSGSNERDLIPGQEPPRTALTDPPAGLRTPHKRVKYTFEPVKETPIVPDPREAMRDEARRDREFR